LDGRDESEGHGDAGRGDDSDARFAAALMNDPEVREGLKLRNIAIPADTVFVAGLHITTTNKVLLYDTEVLTPKQCEELQGWLRRASETQGSEGVRRSRDWSEVRPEWALAGCQAFIAAPRHRTGGRNLQGRAFLHDYTWREDRGFAVLELIMTAPIVVASLPVEGSTVAYAGVGGPMTVPKMVTISPGETAPPM